MTQIDFSQMTQEQRDEHLDRTRYELAKAAHDEKQAKLQERIDASVATSIAANPYLNGIHGSTRMVVREGESYVEHLNPYVPPMSGVDPMTLPLTIGGIQLSPQQARDWVADGSVSKAEYSAAVTEAMQAYKPGYRHSFR